MSAQANLLHGFPAPRRTSHVLAGWGVAAVAVLLVGAAEQAVDQGTVTAGFLWRWRLFPVMLWAAATPAILAAGRRWPVPAPRWSLHVLVHAVLFSGWMLLSNTLLRVPEALAGDAIGRRALAAALEHAPAAALVWSGLLGVGLWIDRSRDGEGTDREEGPRAQVPAPPVSLREGDRTHLVPRRSIRWVEADGDYVEVHAGERVYRVRGPLKELHRRLGDGRFLRLHRSTLVNLGFIREVQPLFHGDYVAVLRDGTQLRIPRSRRAVIRRLLGEPPDSRDGS